MTKAPRTRARRFGLLFAVVAGVWCTVALAQQPTPTAAASAGAPVVPPPAEHAGAGEEHGAAPHAAGHGEGHCPGHGPDDRPPGPNWFHGILGVDNEKAPAPLAPNAGFWDRFLWQLKPSLWRYENKGDACDPRNEPIPLFANILNFGIFAFLLVRFGRKPIRAALQKRKAAIMAEFDRATGILGEAKDRLSHYQGQIDHLDDTLEDLRLQFIEEGKAEELRLVEEMGAMRDRLLADASFRVSQDNKQARDELGRQALDGALRAAQALIAKSITPTDQDKLAEAYLDDLEAALRETGAEVGA